jgi:DNA-binding NtrC family response regulator
MVAEESPIESIVRNIESSWRYRALSDSWRIVRGLGVILGDKLDDSTSGPLADVEREHCRRVLRQSNGNKFEAARRLKINVKTLYSKLKDAHE